jgi:hypothetical protein
MGQIKTLTRIHSFSIKPKRRALPPLDGGESEYMVNGTVTKSQLTQAA